MASEEVAESMLGPTIEWLREQASEHDVVVCGSVVIAENGKFFNRFLWVSPDGNCQKYDKRHLFRMAGEHEHYTPGIARKVFEINSWRHLALPFQCKDLYLVPTLNAA